MQISSEDAKLLTVARAASARNSASAGAAVRDLDGRSYVATSVELASLRIGALDLAVAMAAASGANGIAGAVVLSPEVPDLAAVRDFGGPGITVWLADLDGTQRGSVST